MLKFDTDASLGTGKVYRASTTRFSVFRKTCSTSVTAIPLLMVTLTFCSLILSTPPNPLSATSNPAAWRVSVCMVRNNAVAMPAATKCRQGLCPCAVFMLVSPVIENGWKPGKGTARGQWGKRPGTLERSLAVPGVTGVKRARSVRKKTSRAPVRTICPEDRKTVACRDYHSTSRRPGAGDDGRSPVRDTAQRAPNSRGAHSRWRGINRASTKKALART